MRRLLITLAFPPDVGGMQNFAYHRCLRAGDEPVVLAPWHPGCASFDAGQPFQVRRWRPIAGNVPSVKRIGQLLQPLHQAYRLVRQERFDAVECWQPLPFGMAAWLLKRAYGLPIIIWSHGSDLLRIQRRPLGHLLLRWTLSQADRLIANSLATQTQMQQLGQDATRIRVVYPPVECERFHPEVDSTPVRLRHALADAPVILTVGRLVEKKGVDMMLRALPAVLSMVPDARYLIVGDGPLKTRLQTLAAELDIAGNVHFVGQVDHHSCDLPRYYAACDVYVMPSRTLDEQGEIESFGISYLEAGACGKPVIAGRSGGTAEAVQAGVTGLLVNPWDPDEIAEAVIRLLTDSTLAHRLGTAGRQRALQEPTWEALRLD